jgi:2-keto-4-pentenoate hydratase/2-oxohepta-3-ene-1,7-dioic acid hydratase in catechol pathway
VKLANLGGLPYLVEGESSLDVKTASRGRFPSNDAVIADWTEFQSWAGSVPDAQWQAVPDAPFGPPVPNPGVIWAAGLNYGKHRREALNLADREEDHGLPETFLKSPRAVTGPMSEIRLPSGTVDFEVELVIVIGAMADHVTRSEAMDYVAGFMVGQDVTDRALQYATVPQLSMGKSFQTFAPLGPYLVTVDQIGNLEDAVIESRLNGELMQSDVLGSMLRGVPELVELFSGVGPLVPGDLIFCGTPSGVGHRRTPPRFLVPGDEVVSSIGGIGVMRNLCVAAEG